jgi:hypothetical protein
MNKQIKPEQLALEPTQENKSALEAEVKNAVAHASALLAEDVNADDFDWDNPDNESVVLQEQRATAAYHNRAGELIIRQRAAFNDDSDAFVFVSPENTTAFLEAVAAVARNK